MHCFSQTIPFSLINFQNACNENAEKHMLKNFRGNALIDENSRMLLGQFQKRCVKFGDFYFHF